MDCNYKIGDSIIVTVGQKKLNGIILNIKENYLTVIYVGQNEEKIAYAITDNFDFNGCLLKS